MYRKWAVSTKSTSASTKKLDEVVKKITRSDHRILEKEGKLEPEPMLIENLRRFVLFPIEHDNVSAILMLINFENLIWIYSKLISPVAGYGQCTKKPRHHSGQQKKLISHPASKIMVGSPKTNVTSFLISWPFPQPPTVSCTKTWLVTPLLKLPFLRHDGSMVSKLLLRISIAKHIRYWLIIMWKTPRKLRTFLTLLGLTMLWTQRHHNAANPFEWMEMISLQGKTNIFEKRVGKYSKSGVGVDAREQEFSLDADS